MFSMMTLVAYWIYEALHEARLGPLGEDAPGDRTFPGWDEAFFAH